MRRFTLQPRWSTNSCLSIRRNSRLPWWTQGRNNQSSTTRTLEDCFPITPQLAPLARLTWCKIWSRLAIYEPLQLAMLTEWLRTLPVTINHNTCKSRVVTSICLHHSMFKRVAPSWIKWPALIIIQNVKKFSFAVAKVRVSIKWL